MIHTIGEDLVTRAHNSGFSRLVTGIHLPYSVSQAKRKKSELDCWTGLKVDLPHGGVLTEHFEKRRP